MAAKNLKFINQTEKSKPLNIYGYTCFREYLKDFYEYKKDSASGYSYRAFSKAAGFSSPNYLKLVIEGHRNISRQAAEKFVKALRLEGSMAMYFRVLVQMNQATGDYEKSCFFDELKRLTPHEKRRELCADSLKYLSSWLYPVLKEMVELVDFNDDPYWISRRLYGKASVNEVVSALKFLLSAGFISKNDKGKYQAEDKMLLTSDEVKSLAIRQYHRQMLAQASDALESIPMEEREFGALTLTIPDSAKEQLKFKLKKFRQELHEWAMQVAEDSGDTCITQVNLQMYPHTRKFVK